MLDYVFTSILGSTESAAAGVTSGDYFLCTIASILLGLIVAVVYMYRNSYSKSFVVTIALLPVIVQMVIMLVNGNIGAGVAVMGVFNLVRFRSIPGSAKDIASVFLSMAIGLATGMGFLSLAIVFTIIVSILNIVFSRTSFGKKPMPPKVLSITVPEDLEFEGMFDEVFTRYTEENELTSVQTSNMGALYQLKYNILMKEGESEKAMIDELRCLNGNLKISCGLAPIAKEVL